MFPFKTLVTDILLKRNFKKSFENLIGKKTILIRIYSSVFSSRSFCVKLLYPKPFPLREIIIFVRKHDKTFLLFWINFGKEYQIFWSNQKQDEKQSWMGIPNCFSCKILNQGWLVPGLFVYEKQ